MANPQVSFTAVLQASTTVEQYQALLNVIQEAANSYQHMIVSITTNNIPPETLRLPVAILATGMADPDARAAVQAALDQLKTQHPTINWHFADVPDGG